MDSRQLRYFAAVHEHRSLSLASEAVNVATSALSHHIGNLEAELGTRLFVRKPRGMMPTAAGERLAEHARTILRAMAAAEEDIRDEGREVSGEVSVGLAYSAVKAIGLPLIKTVMQDYPKLKMSVSESLSGANLVQLMASEIDLALVYNPPSDPRLRSQPIIEEEMVLLGVPELIGGADAPIRFAEVLELPLILLRQGLSARALLDDTALLRQLEARARLQLNSVNAIAGSLREGLGVAIGTRLFMREMIEAGTLLARPIADPRLTRTLSICEQADRSATYALETLRNLLIRLTLAAASDGTWDARPVSA